MRRTFVLALAAALGCAEESARAGNWPRFRGENGAATAVGENIPVEWTPESILWKTKLPGVGASSPAIWGDRIFLTSAEEEGKIRLVLCYDLPSGKLLWKREFPFGTHKKHNKNSYATSTPTTDGKHVYAVFTDSEQYRVICLDVEGKPVWDKELGAFASQHGSGASPILFEDRLIVCNEQDGPSFIACLSKDTGELEWRTPRKQEIVAYGTPFLLKTEHGPRIICCSKAGLVALDPKDGSEEWICDPFEARVVASPIEAQGLVIAHSGSGSKGDRMIAVRPDGKGDVTASHIVWQETRMLPYCTTPVAVGEHIFTVNDAPGLARCLVAKTGREVWTERLEGNFFSSPVCVDERIYAVGEKGDVYVFAAATRFQLLARNKLDDFFVTTPAVASGRMVLRGEEYLWCIGNPKRAP